MDPQKDLSEQKYRQAQSPKVMLWVHTESRLSLSPSADLEQSAVITCPWEKFPAAPPAGNLACSRSLHSLQKDDCIQTVL